MKGNIYTINSNKEGLELKNGSIIKLTASIKYPRYVGEYLIRTDRNNIQYDWILLKKGCAFTDINDFEWEIIKQR